MVVVSGVAADLDFLSYLGGPSAFLRLHCGVLRSVLGSIVRVSVVAFVFWVGGCRVVAIDPASMLPPLSFFAAVAVCAVGVVAHLLVELASGIGVQLLWPFR